MSQPAKNLLNLWYKEAFVLSSPLNVGAMISRQKVDFIHATLKDYFGEKYFEVQMNTDMEIKKIPWMFGLLSNHREIRSMHALHDICLLTRYAHTLDQKIQQEFNQLKRHPENLRTFFFELFIYRFLDANNIVNEKKPMYDEQPLDGTCHLRNEHWLFECRKTFLPNIQELDVMRRLLQDVWQLGHRLSHGRPMIAKMHLSRPVTSAHRQSLGEVLRTFFNGLNAINQPVDIRYQIDSRHGSFQATNYDEPTLVEATMAKDYDILFYIKPPLYPVPGMPDWHTGRMLCNFQVNPSEIYKKLERVLKEKAKQHRDSVFDKRIFFLDNEILPEFHMNLFPNEDMFNLELVRRVCTKLRLKEIVCVIRRSYDAAGLLVKTNVVAPSHLESDGSYLEEVFSKTYRH